MLTPLLIGQVVRQARKAQGLRQDQLAAAAGVGVRFIVDVEAGKSSTHLGKVLDVLAALGCTMTLSARPERKK